MSGGGEDGCFWGVGLSVVSVRVSLPPESSTPTLTALSLGGRDPSAGASAGRFAWGCHLTRGADARATPGPM